MDSLPIRIDGWSSLKRSFTLPLLKCLGPIDANYALIKVYESICRDHLGDRSLAYKILRQGYYWLTIQKDVTDFIKKSDQCQRY